MNHNEADIELMNLAIVASRAALNAGNYPYGAVLASSDAKVIHISQNNQNTNEDSTGHAEMVLMREASLRFGATALKGATVYASGEPCAMCTGALFWSGIERIVFAASNETLAEVIGGDILAIKCATVLAGASRHIQVDGPLLEPSAVSVLRDARSKISEQI
ncbi:MAG: nucleoside deaminase [Proteobacteria bacterium]|nr:MAG: nucleoside deaminase [Pseudomonadota bacterium]